MAAVLTGEGNARLLLEYKHVETRSIPTLTMIANDGKEALSMRVWPKDIMAIVIAFEQEFYWNDSLDQFDALLREIRARRDAKQAAWDQTRRPLITSNTGWLKDG
jgi:hypothetical protein